VAVHPPPPPEGPPTRDPPRATPTADLETTCPRCGAPYEPGQEYCLECGLRLPTHPGVVARLGRAWQRRLSWYPGDWIWLTALAAIVAALAGAGSAIWVARSDESGQPVVVGTTRATPTTATTPTAPEQTTPTQTQTQTTQRPQRPAPKTIIAWPAGRSGWTVVVASIPLQTGRAAAVAQARKAISSGLPKVGILASSSYSSLHPGYFVVFSGIYDSQDDAKNAEVVAKARGFQAYHRPIRR
jgi:hypothetical protein